MDQPLKIDKKWWWIFPFAAKKEKEIYNIQLEKERKRLLTPVENIRYRQRLTIDDVSKLLIFLIITLWTLLPPLVNLPDWLTWMNLGMEGFGYQNWGNQAFLTIIPAGAGSLLHSFPNWVRGKKTRLMLNAIIKLLPIIILISTYYLIKTEKQIRLLKKLESKNELEKMSIKGGD